MFRAREDKFAISKPIRMLSIVVAAYNESRTIESCLSNLREVLDTLQIPSEIIVVESNSTDDTRQILLRVSERLRLSTHFQDSPEGKGSAIRIGLEHISGDVFLIFDADTEYDPWDIPKLLTPIEKGFTSFVLGTRHEKGRPMRSMDGHSIRPKIMNLAHVFFTGIVNVFFQVRLTDPFTMYKVIRVEVFESVPLVSNRFDFDWELIAKAIRRGSYPLEIPVSYKSRSFAEGKKIQFIRDPMTWVVAVIRFRFCKLTTH